MDEKEYLDLLEKAYSELPEVVHKKERFVIPKVRGKIERNRTLIINFGEIAKTLHRPIEHIMKFFLKEGGVRGEVERNTLVLHSKFSPKILDKILERYFKNYVECPVCHRPDTVLKEDILNCKACGYTGPVKPL